ncbi:MOSC domain-containing protein [uncultured Ilumatobacter sp.]|uniref:MOSC domain-containing protein n=1 Tax=uncultured Ilumatobacter sp. TaxID=879968 RepID=UPI00374EBEDD|tara:strand:+ start:350 stop:1066 length:717 start_codon:yes stop_codon:yes gene_type:complete
MNWYEICEWNAQDATRTLEHIDGLLALWTADIGDHSRESAAACDRIANISQSWRKHHDQPALAAELWRHLTVIAAASPEIATNQFGAVAQINSSTGGVPKSAIDTATVGWRGIEGDVQKTRLHHGRPWQALSLWSADVIDQFVSDGHPVSAGGVGENLTLRSIEWSALRAGTVLDIGQVRCQLTAPAVPCSKIAANFTGRETALVDHDINPENSRWYAAVVRPGLVARGDVVTVSPSS